MKVRVYGAQPDELRLYEEAEKQGDLSFVFAKAPLNEETVQEVQDCEALILLTNCQVNEKVAEALAAALQRMEILLQGSGHGLYVHLPFCQAKCGYCNLFSVTGQSESEIDRYLEAVERQSIQYERLLRPVQTEFSELTIGGGTPLYLSERQLEQLLAVRKAPCQQPADR